MRPRIFFIGLLALTVAGCVTGHRTIELKVAEPEAGKSPVAVAPGSLGSAAVTTIEDKRTFQNKPPEPWMPSLKEDVNGVPREKLATMVGRQRNGYGMAMGDIEMSEGDNVINKTRQLVETGLQRRGYQVVPNGGGGGRGARTTARVTIDEFWAWFTPGFWTIDFEARITCTITLGDSTAAARTLVVKGYAKNQGQFASDRNWEQAYSEAFQDFLVKMDAELNKAGVKRG